MYELSNNSKRKEKEDNPKTTNNKTKNRVQSCVSKEKQQEVEENTIL